MGRLYSNFVYWRTLGIYIFAPLYVCNQREGHPLRVCVALMKSYYHEEPATLRINKKLFQIQSQRRKYNEMNVYLHL